MLYVFLVDEGTMYKFDMNVALSSVSNLKETIERRHKIPAENIVLLVSGGEMLTKSTQVSFYSAGTDTNPIYMFLMGDVDRPMPVLPPIDNDNMKESVEQCLAMPAVYETVVSRARLALQMYELAREEESICEQLVHEQHLQQQGWSAVVANMEDLTEEFRQRFKNFCISFDRHLEIRNSLFELLNSFSQDLNNLSRIPILPGLMQMAQEDFRGFDGLLDNDEIFSQSQQNLSVLMAPDAQCSTAQGTLELQDDDKRDSTSPNKKAKISTDVQKSDIESVISGGSGTRGTLTLLQWISAEENNSKLKEMAEECIQSLNAFNEAVYAKLKHEINTVIRSADQSDMKEVKGLSDRLCKLEEMKYKIKHMVQDQKVLSSAFQQNQNRAINLKDASILPDLCASHKSQLSVMLQNHQKIRELRRCIAKAKNELGLNLHTRLKRIVVLENKMSDLDSRQLFHHRCLRRAERHINIIEQIHRAPSIYVAAVTEVVRRKIFSQEFRQWASKLAIDFDSIHSEEIVRRRDFNASFEGHFLNILFPGMHDMPPAFANENPLGFDTRLPNLTKSDIDVLKASLPDLMEHIHLPDMRPVVDFFISRSGNQQSNLRGSVTNKSNTSGINTTSAIVQHQRVSDLQIHLKDGCEESETDTEEFEKVIQPELLRCPEVTASESTGDNAFQMVHTGTSTDPLETNTVETITEENLGSTRLEVERLKAILKSMADVSSECLNLARVNCNEIKTEQEINQVEFRFQFENITEKWQLAQMQYMSCQEEMLAMTNKHQADIDNFKSVVESKDLEIQELKNELQRQETGNNETLIQIVSEHENLKEECDRLKKQIESLTASLEIANAEKQRAVTEAREQLIHEHKSEIESLRCRYKLMASMEHSPSDNSLEKIDKSEGVGLVHHEAIIAQMREKLLEEQEAAIKKVIEIERAKWEANTNPNPNLTDDANTPLNILNDMMEEKDKHIDMLHEKTTALAQENMELKTQLSALSNDDANSLLKEKIEFLNKEKIRIEKQLNMEKSRRSEMEHSFAVLKGSAMEASGIQSSSRTKLSGCGHRCVAIESCKKGDIVLVAYSNRHNQYMIVQDSPILYFVHSDSLNALNLRLTSPEQLDTFPTFFTLARVIRKEYCLARKSKNRFKVDKGLKFYRVILEALSSKESKLFGREHLEGSSSSTSISRSICPIESSEPTTSRLVSPNEQSSTRLIGSDDSTDPIPLPDATDSTGQTLTKAASNVDSPSSSAIPDINIGNKSVISIGVTEDDDEPISLISERCRYVSVSEEEETNRSVITEQPTISSFPPMTSASMSSPTTNTAAFTSQSVLSTNHNASPMQILANIGNCSLEKDTDDSDEYRSLEAKDDNDFPPTSQN